MITLIVLAVIAVKVYFDNKNWGKVNHLTGAFWVGVVLLPASLSISSLYPFWLFGLLFNPAINLVRGLPLFYIGDTAWVDRILKKIFKTWAGESFALLMLILTLNSIFN